MFHGFSDAILISCPVGIGVDNPANNWVLDTSQFDNILKRLKVVMYFIFMVAM